MTKSAVEANLSDVLVDDAGEALPGRHVEFFEFWKPQADAIPDADLKPPNVEGSLAHANAEVAATNLAPYLDRETPGVDVALVRGLPGIALAYVYSWALWNAALPVANQPVAPLLKKVRRDRKLFLLVLEAAAMIGLVDEKLVEDIKRGNGPEDNVKDVIASTVLFRGPAKSLVGTGPFVTEASLAEAEKRALQVDRLLRPDAAPGTRAPATDEEREALRIQRDRFYALLLKGYAQAELLGVSLVGLNNVRTLVPSMFARRKKKKTKSE